MSQRDRIRMSDDEIESFLASARKLQIASVNPDGAPHLATMYYTLLDGDLIKRQRVYGDNAELMAQLGLMPAPAGA